MTRKPLPSEFDLIERHFAPLSQGEPGAFSLGDDAAVLGIGEGRELVVTTDTLIDGVHFLSGTDPDIIAARALAVNLSDLAAMGAEPRAYFLSLGLPRDDLLDDAWVAAFADGLGAAQQAFDVTLVGGDTVAVPGPLTLGVTALGTVLAGQAIRRAGARPGDLICVSGTIGDSALGLRVHKGGLSGLERPQREFLADRFDAPKPRLALGAALVGVASAALDVSDGLAADLGHLCRQSKVRAKVRIADLPLSAAGREAVRDEHSLLGPCVLAGGDDYELVFTVPPGRREAALSAGERTRTPVTIIGEVETGPPCVHFFDSEGAEVVPPQSGYRHF